MTCTLKILGIDLQGLLSQSIASCNHWQEEKKRLFYLQDSFFLLSAPCHTNCTLENIGTIFLLKGKVYKTYNHSVQVSLASCTWGVKVLCETFLSILPARWLKSNLKVKLLLCLMQAIIDDEVTKRFSAEGLYQNWSGSVEARRNGRLTTQLNYWNKKKRIVLWI